MLFTNLKLLTCFAMACAVAFTTDSVAQDSRDGDTVRQQNNQQSENEQRQTNQSQNDMAEQWIGSLSEKVDLQDEQKQQIRDQLNQHRQKFMSTWQKFNKSHMTAVMLEAQFYAALEDQMNTQQQQQFRQGRDQSSSADSQGNSVANSSERTYQKDDGSSKQVQETSGRANNADTTTDNQTTQNEGSQGNREHGQQSDKGTAYVAEMIIVPVQRVYYSVSLDDSQKSQCDTTCRQYHNKLSTAWNEIHQHHDELVKLEAEKIEAVENVLTEEQRTKLREQRTSESDQ